MPKKDGPVHKNGRLSYRVQFTIWDEDVAEFFSLFSPEDGDSAAPVAKQLFLHGLDWCARAYSEHVTPHQKKRRKRLELDD